MLISPTLLQYIRVDQYLYSWDLNMDIADGAEDLSLEEILSLYSQPINEEQAWAVCYQCCRTLARKHRRRNSQTSGSSVGDLTRRIEGPGDVRILRDGTVQLHHQDSADKYRPPNTSLEVIESLGIMIYKALDYSLKESEERELSPPLEQLIDMMTNMAEKERDSDPCPDEGYEATEEEEDEEDPNTVCNVKGFRDIIMLCTSHLPSPSDAPNHYQAVCRALYAETRELRSFLEKIRSAKENLRRMEGDTREEPVRDLNELQNADWLNGDIPPRLKKSAHEVILDFIRSRPPLNPVAARKLKPHPARPRSLHERLLEGIKQERKLRPVSPDMTRRNHLGAVKSISTPQDLNRSSDLSTPDVLRKHASSTLALSCPPAHGVGGALGQRKRLLKAPTLAELYSSESDDEPSHSSSSLSASMLDASSPGSVLGKNTPPRLLPITMTPQPDSRPSPQRRHSIEKEPPTSVRPFTAPTRQSSKSLVENPAPSSGAKVEDFCYPVECLALTVEEVMHIRQVLVKAELEKFQQYKDVYNELRKGKLCFSCQTKRFSFFTWSYTCQVCKRPVCSQCCKKMRLPSKPYANLPVSSLGPTATLPREEAGGTSALDTPEKPSSSHSLRRTVSRLSEYNSSEGSRDEPELDLPKELTDDWCTMEVCINCKKFISEIISSSKRSLTLATKRACLKRKTQSFYLSSPNTDDYRPSERTINQV
ncbi:protein spire homolog 1 isoform X3 [Oncorhynchus kisutch]|uniref:protein spire homolog 1 isoform X3 n=1 Tax=Oncorhynchus kisutch TaxID=8019 RepID=UPI0012DD535A|nr:protein spire homolog 1-like isoform X3 [Oncorhynchus kisutch]